MKITYDKTVDALNISLRSGKVKRTVEVAPEMFADMDENDNTLSLEIIGASEKIDKENFESVTVGANTIPLTAMA